MGAQTHDSLRALKNDSFVKLVVGKNPAQTFLIPKSQIELSWAERELRGPESYCLSKRLKEAVKELNTAKTTKPPLSPRSLFSSSKPKIPEVCLPEDDPIIWSALLHWLADPERAILKAMGANDVTSVKSWNLGMKYNFVEFADDAMICLVQGFDVAEKRNPRVQSISLQAIQETYCSDYPGKSKLREVVTEEMLKSGLFSKCKYKESHAWKDCPDCREDKLLMDKKFTCSQPANEDHRCGIREDLWKDHMNTNDKFLAKEQRWVLFNRLTVQAPGEPPSYMNLLVSDKWKDLVKVIKRVAASVK